MSSVNRESVREEAERIKAEFSRLSSLKKLDTEVALLFQGMLALIHLLIAIFLEKTTKKTAKNSSLPPSKTDKDDSSTGKTNTNTKGTPEVSRAAKNTRTIENTTYVPVVVCEICGHDLESTPCDHVERRTKIDIIFEKVVEHVDVEVKQCPSCDGWTSEKFPEDMKAPLQYGSGIKAYTINLLVSQMLSLNRVQKMLHTLIGEKLSEASLLNFVLRLHDALAGWESNAISRLLTFKALHVDETSLRVDKKNQWIHVYSGENITLQFLHPKRGLEAMTCIDIIPRYTGTIIHDCWASYLSYTHCSHGLCGSHLVRELTAIIESNQYDWAVNMKRLLLETCRKVSRLKRKKLSEKACMDLQKQYRHILTCGKKELPVIPPKPNGKRGAMAKSDAHNLWERLSEYESSVLLFAKLPEVSFTNNRAERDLRMTKVKQKVSGCFRSELYAKAYCRISSYLKTMAYKGYNPLTAIEMALNAEFIAL